MPPYYLPNWTEKHKTEKHKLVVKPSLGVKPERIWKDERMSDLKRAIYDRLEAHMKIPDEWIEEYNKLLNELR